MKSPQIGLKQAKRIAKMTPDRRDAFISEGLDIICASAQSFWESAKVLSATSREAEILEDFATEEAAKILIFLDIYRAPAGQRSAVFECHLKRIYSHHARLLYVDATSWKPVNKAQLQDYLDHSRQSHIVDGPVSEFIMPHGPTYRREQKLYADVVAYEDDEVHWNDPLMPFRMPRPFLRHAPPILSLVSGMKRLGIFSVDGLDAITSTWGETAFRDEDGLPKARSLSLEMLGRLEARGQISEEASEADVGFVADAWPFPMWDMELRRIDVPLEELEAERDGALWAEIGESEWR